MITKPMAFLSGVQFRSVACGAEHVLAIDSKRDLPSFLPLYCVIYGCFCLDGGKLWAWGANASGQCGRPAQSFASVPHIVHIPGKRETKRE